jgi:hypothetical protein
MNAALIVSSTAGFAKFMGNHVVPQFNNARFVLATKFGFGGGGRPFDKLDEVHNPNRPRTGLQQVPGAGMELKDTKKRMKMGDTWLLRSETTVVDMEGGVNTT